MITDFPNNLRQFVYLSRYAPPTPEALTSNLSVPEGVGERCCASCKRRVAILSYEHISVQQFCTLTRKVLDFQGLFVFLGVKYTPFSLLHLFPVLMDLNL